MPELPEVELVARTVDALVRGRTITKARLLRERLAPAISPRRFATSLSSTTISRVHRRGKHILFDLGNGKTLITHLRMSGRFMLFTADHEDPKFTHAVFYFDDDTRLVFQDQRHFGYMNLVSTSKLSEARELKKLAPEPFSDDFTIDYLRVVLKSSKRSLKEVLLDQTKICGLGNIYASEALFRARIHPAKRSDRVSRIKAPALFESIRSTLAEAIDAGSTLNVDPENIDGSYDGGGFESRWSVYDRDGQPCLICSCPIRKLRQGGRSSYYCSKCQR
jgi:formamidopyrimidine-DNA glycosylase